MSGDYFAKLGKRTQPLRDAVEPRPAKVNAPAKVQAPKAPEAGKPIGQLQGESLEDFDYMRKSIDKIGKRLMPKSVMGKTAPKR